MSNVKGTASKGGCPEVSEGNQNKLNDYGKQSCLILEKSFQNSNVSSFQSLL
jgi:hypothetical protein